MQVKDVPRAATRVLREQWRSYSRVAALGALFVALALGMLRPSPHDLHDTLPENLGDPPLVAWILRHGAHSLTHDPASVFDAPIFWPNPDSFAYSESMLPVAPVYGIERLVVRDDILAMNLVIVTFFVFNLAVTYALARRLLGSARAALVSAIAFAFTGFVMARAGHPHLQPVGVFALGYLGLLYALDAPSVRRGALAGIANAVAFLTSLYFGLVWGVCLAIFLAGWMLRRRFRIGRQAVWSLAAMAAVSAALVLPVARVYARQDVSRPLVPEWGLNLRDFLTPAYGTYAHKWIESHGTLLARTEHTYFPGVLPVLLAIAGAVSIAVATGLRTRARTRGLPDAGAVCFAPGVRIEPLILIALGGAAAVALAFGPAVGDHTGPFRFFHDHVPGFSGIRVASRLAVPGLLAIALLAGAGVTALLDRLPVRAGHAVTVLLCAVVLVELAAPTRRVEFDRSDEAMAVYEALAASPAGAVVELPMIDPDADPASWPYVEAPRMLRATTDWHPRVNGYSGDWPVGYAASAQAFARFPDDVALERAQELDVRYVVLHTSSAAASGAYSEADAQEIVDALPDGAEARRAGEAWLIDLRAR